MCYIVRVLIYSVNTVVYSNIRITTTIRTRITNGRDGAFSNNDIDIDKHTAHTAY